jgi:Fe-S-cluster containining protein
MRVLHFPTGQNYDCVGCGRSCQAWNVAVEENVVEALKLHPLGQEAFRRQGEGYAMKMGDGQRCVMLSSENACRIHAELGAQAKPTTCQTFPFHVTDTPDGVYVGVSFYCTSVRQNSGRPLAEHELELRQLMARGICVTSVDDVQLTSVRRVAWSSFCEFESQLRERIPSQGLDLTLQQALLVLALDLPWEEMGQPPLGGQLTSMLENLTFGLVKLFLDDTSGARLAELDAAFAQEGELHLPEFAWRGTWWQFLRFQEQAVGERFEDEIDRWVEVYLHRKGLVVARPVLDNLWMLALIPRLLRCFTALFASADGQSRAELSHYFRALEWCEKYFGANGNLGDQLGPKFTLLLENLAN